MRDLPSETLNAIGALLQTYEYWINVGLISDGKNSLTNVCLREILFVFPRRSRPDLQWLLRHPCDWETWSGGEVKNR